MGNKANKRRPKSRKLHYKMKRAGYGVPKKPPTPPPARLDDLDLSAFSTSTPKKSFSRSSASFLLDDESFTSIDVSTCKIKFIFIDYFMTTQIY